MANDISQKPEVVKAAKIAEEKALTEKANMPAKKAEEKPSTEKAKEEEAVKLVPVLVQSEKVEASEIIFDNNREQSINSGEAIIEKADPEQEKIDYYNGLENAHNGSSISDWTTEDYLRGLSPEKAAAFGQEYQGEVGSRDADHTLTLDFDSYGPSENTWNIYDYGSGTYLYADNQSVATSDPFDVIVNLAPGTYDLDVWDSYGDYGLYYFYVDGALQCSYCSYGSYSYVSFTVSDPVSCEDTELVVTVGGGSYASEKSWSIDDTDFAGSGDGSWDICLADGDYTFRMNDSWGDGWGTGNYATVSEGDTVIGQGSLDSGSSGSFDFSVGAPPPVYGCTDDTALNYNADANSDDGSCYWTGDDCSAPFDGAGSGSLDSYGAAWHSVTLSDNLLSATIDLCGSSFDTKLEVHSNCADGYIAYNDDSYDCTGSYSSRSLITLDAPAAGDYLVKVYGYGSSYGDYVLAVSETAVVEGCMEATADNYDASANTSCADGDGDGIGDCCVFTQVPGCTDESAQNYDSEAEVDDGSCILPGDACSWPDSDGSSTATENYGWGDYTEVCAAADGNGAVVSWIQTSGYHGAVASWTDCSGYSDVFDWLHNSPSFTLAAGQCLVYQASDYNGYNSWYGPLVVEHSINEIVACDDDTACNTGDFADCWYADAGFDCAGACVDTDANLVEIEVYAGTYGSEMSIELAASDGTVVLQAGPFSNYTEYDFAACVADDIYTFSAIDSYGDGWNSGGHFSLSANGEALYTAVAVTGSGQSYTITLTDDIAGCTDTAGCNYNADATVDDGSCSYPENGFDCAGDCSGSIFTITAGG